MFNGLFGAIPKVRNLSNSGIDNTATVEVELHAPPRVRLDNNFFEAIVNDQLESDDLDDASLLIVPVTDTCTDNCDSVVGAFKNRECSDISRRLRSFSNYQSVEKLEKTPPRKLWGHGQAARSAGSPLTSSSLNSSFKNTPIAIFSRKVSHFLRNKSFDGGENQSLRQDTPLLSGAACREDCSASSSEQSASVIRSSLKELTGKEGGFPIRQSPCLGAINRVATRSVDLGNDAALNQLDRIDGIYETPHRIDRTEEFATGNGRASGDNNRIVPYDTESRRSGEKNIAVCSRATSNSSRANRIRPKRKRGFLTFLAKTRASGYRRGRGIPQPRKGDWRRFFVLKRQSSALSEDDFRGHSVASSIPDIDQPDLSTTTSPARNSQTKPQAQPTSVLKEASNLPRTGVLRKSTITTGSNKVQTCRHVSESLAGRSQAVGGQGKSGAKSSSAKKQASTIGRGSVAAAESITAPSSRGRSQPQRLPNRFHSHSNTYSPGAGLGNFQRNIAINQNSPTNNTRMSTANNQGYARASELSDFARCQYIRTSLQSLSSFSGGPLQRFDSWLDMFEKIILNSGFSDEEKILELYKKMTDRAQKVMKYILESGADEYDSVKEKLMDHFHGDETAEKYLKKFKKASKKPGEKIYDFAIRLKEIFKYAYPDAYMQDSFQIILQQKFIDGLDEKLQMKVKYKTFQTFDELVSETRKYSVRLEAMEGNKGNHEFVNQISRSSDKSQLRESLELVELKQIIEKQNEKHSESVKAVVAALKDEFKSNSAALCTEQSDMSLRMLELTKAMNYLLGNGNDQGSRPPKNVSFQLLDQQQGQMPSGLSFHSSQKYTNEPGQHFYDKSIWQPRPPYQPINQHGNRPSFPPGQPLFPQGQPPFSPGQPRFPSDNSVRPTKICNFCKRRGHTQDVCFQYQRLVLEGAQPPVCYFCRQIGHLAYQCPTRFQTGQKHPNIPGPPPSQGNH